MAGYDNITAKDAYDQWPKDDNEHQNVTYCNSQVKEEIYDNPIDKPADYELPQNVGKNVVPKISYSKKNVRVESGVRTSIIIASIALVLSLLALLVAIVTVAIYYSTHWIEVANSYSQDNHLSVSASQQTMIQTLQVELNDTKNEVMNLQAELSKLTSIVDMLSQVPATETTSAASNTVKTHPPNTEVSTTKIPTSEAVTNNAMATDAEPAAMTNFTLVETTSTLNTDTEAATMDPPTTKSTTTDISTTETALPLETCGGQGWRQVAFINMTDPNQDCPQGLNLTDYSIRSCGRSVNGLGVCSSVVFPVNGSSYSQVCGRVTAYRWGLNYAFLGYHDRGETIEGYYVDGLSLTHGSPRTHIWSFTGGTFSGTSSRDAYANERCPCDPGNTYGSPPFVGNDYFCESVATVDNWNANRGQLFPDNALWDGQDHLNTCYGLNGPPWFN